MLKNYKLPEERQAKAEAKELERQRQEMYDKQKLERKEERAKYREKVWKEYLIIRENGLNFCQYNLEATPEPSDEDEESEEEEEEEGFGGSSKGDGDPAASKISKLACIPQLTSLKVFLYFKLYTTCRYPLHSATSIVRSVFLLDV